MERGYIKLYRSIETNDLFIRDKTSLIVFIYILISADWKTGELKTGRKVLAAKCNLKPSTTYAALKRLQKMNMISMRSNNQMTTIHICNWRKYQMDDDKAVNTESIENDTIQEVRSKKKNNIKEINKEKDNETYKRVLDYWSEIADRKLSDTKSSRLSFEKLLKARSEEDIKYAIKGAVYFQGKEFKPQVMSFASLYEKWDTLIGHMQSEKKEKGTKAKHYSAGLTGYKTPSELGMPSLSV